MCYHTYLSYSWIWEVSGKKINKTLQVLSQLLLCRTYSFVNQQPPFCTPEFAHSGTVKTRSGWLTRQISVQGVRKVLRPLHCKPKLLPAFISITSHQNSSPTEVATVPLAIKIMLGHAMAVCDSTVRNKSSGSSGNDANSWVVNLEQCRQKPWLWFLKKLRAGPVRMFRFEPYWKISNRETTTHSVMSLCLLYHSVHTFATLKKGGCFP